MASTLATAKNRHGHAIRLQRRGSKFDVIVNTTGIASSWRYLRKAVSESDARSFFELEAIYQAR